MKIKGFQDTINWYNQNAKQYSQNQGYQDFDHINAFVNLLPKNASVLDAGCGFGKDSNTLSEQGLKVVGLDISNGLLDVAKKKYPNLTFVEGDMLALPFDDATFDGVWSDSSLLHFENTQEVSHALNEFNRVLKEDGILHVLVKAQTGKEKTAIVEDSLSKHPRFFRYFTVSELTGLLEDSNFSIIQSKRYRESDKFNHGRSEVELIWILARKK